MKRVSLLSERAGGLRVRSLGRSVGRSVGPLAGGETEARKEREGGGGRKGEGAD